MPNIVKQKLKKSPIYYFLLSNESFVKWKYPDLVSYAKQFIQNNQIRISSDIDSISAQMVAADRRYRITFAEFFQFHFENKSENYKRKFVGDIERHVKYTSQLNKNPEVFKNKWKTYELFKPYFRRDVFLLSNPYDYDGFKKFFSMHRSFIVKPVELQEGKGIQIINDTELTADTILENFHEQYNSTDLIVEELVNEDVGLACVHPQSVNTIRIATFHFGDHIECKYPVFRMGIGDSVVDNAAAGGIFGAIDLDTGKILRVADELGNHFDSHPDSGIEFADFIIPKWNELKELSIKLAGMIPDNKYCSWDFALNSDKEWVLIEVNSSGHILWQIAMSCGIRDELEAIVKKIMLSDAA